MNINLELKSLYDDFKESQSRYFELVGENSRMVDIEAVEIGKLEALQYEARNVAECDRIESEIKAIKDAYNEREKKLKSLDE